MNNGFKVVAADDNSVTIEDHTQPKQRFRGGQDRYPTITYLYPNSVDPIQVGDTVQLLMRRIRRASDQ